MTFFDYALLIVAILVLVYQLYLLMKSKKTVIIKGTPPNRKTVAVLIIIVLVLAVVRTQNLAQTWPIFVIMALVCMMLFAGGCGLSLDGMYGSGRYISFKTAEYYLLDEKSREGLTFRLSKLTRENSMLISPEQVAEIEALMKDNRIPTFEEYQKKMSKRLDSRVAASQGKKKKKK